MRRERMAMAILGIEQQKWMTVGYLDWHKADYVRHVMQFKYRN